MPDTKKKTVIWENWAPKSNLLLGTWKMWVSVTNPITLIKSDPKSLKLDDAGCSWAPICESIQENREAVMPISPSTPSLKAPGTVLPLSSHALCASISAASRSSLLAPSRSTTILVARALVLWRFSSSTLQFAGKILKYLGVADQKSKKIFPTYQSSISWENPKSKSARIPKGLVVPFTIDLMTITASIRAAAMLSQAVFRGTEEDTRHAEIVLFLDQCVPARRIFPREGHVAGRSLCLSKKKVHTPWGFQQWGLYHMHIYIYTTYI